MGARGQKLAGIVKGEEGRCWKMLGAVKELRVRNWEIGSGKELESKWVFNCKVSCKWHFLAPANTMLLQQQGLQLAEATLSTVYPW